MAPSVVTVISVQKTWKYTKLSADCYKINIP